MIFNHRTLANPMAKKAHTNYPQTAYHWWMDSKSVWSNTIQLMFCACLHIITIHHHYHPWCGRTLCSSTNELDFEYSKQIICVYCTVLCSFNNRAKMPIRMLPKKACKPFSKLRMMYAYWILSMMLDREKKIYG